MPEATRRDECPRCGDLATPDDFSTDPRWGRVCDDCHEHLLMAHGLPSDDDRAE